MVADPPVANVKSGTVPVPESDTVCGLLAALSVIVNDPVLVPTAVGLKVTEIVQFASGAKDVPHVFVPAKSPVN